MPACQVQVGSVLEYHAEVKATNGIRPVPKKTAVVVVLHSSAGEPFQRSIPVLILPSWWLIACWAISAVFLLLVRNRYADIVKQTDDPWSAVGEMVANWRFLFDVGCVTLLVGVIARAVGFGWLLAGDPATDDLRPSQRHSRRPR